MSIKSKYLIWGWLVISIFFSSCKKYLNHPSDKKLTIIETLGDLQSLLDQYFTINQRDPCLGEPASDNIYLDFSTWQSLDEFERAVYIWQNLNVVWPYSHYGSGNAWSQCYDIIYKANVVLDNIHKINKDERNAEVWENIMGQSYFLRGKSLLQVAWIWSLAYDSVTADEDLGIPLRLNADFNEVSQRATLRRSYEQILEDLIFSAQLLPAEPLNPYRPGKAAAYGYIARTYLSMRDYKRAGLYADSALMIKSNLLDFNADIAIAERYPFKALNREVIYVSKMGLSIGLYLSKIDSLFYKSYEDDDLRKTAFFYTNGDGSYSFRGSYDGSPYPFTGITTDEMYLISMEANARLGNITEAAQLLNALLFARWRTGTYIPFVPISQQEMIEKILEERRKELTMRDLRWIDIKRFNKEDAGIYIRRLLDGNEYVLEPNDLRYAMAIPEDIIERSGMPQNKR
ncbi:MAG TPA: RagB/SusD family nutrient uptake outer membrane protein [Niabella sp.]|nr:RagB/SusD family nutrient uptake outer membrane protein [Agriterribacter sp.]HUN03245.1 RagB/SusD family nutrient uptake outer membrane protein [Niabella sp.]